MISAGHIDLYQLTSLVTHHVAGHTDDRVVMTFLSRALPKNPHTGERARDFVVWCGLQKCLDYLGGAAFSDEAVSALLRHGMLGGPLALHPDLIDRLRKWRFSGTVWSPPEGTLLTMGKAVREDGTPLEVDGCTPSAYCPYLVIETDLLSAKLIETPLLSVINHMSMVASKAARVARAAGHRPVMEFGQRRTHPDAAVDASLAAWVGGCSSTSNVEAHLRYGVPVAGTMDHFAVQAWERPGVPRHETEEAFFRAFAAMYPGQDTLLVDTYDTFGEHTGLASAVRATDGKGPSAVRIDSNVTADNVRRARQRLDALGAKRTKIYVSGGIDERAMKDLSGAPIDGYGVGENLVVSSDAPVGVGAVGKLTEVRGVPTTKLSRGSAKAHLPGRVQVWRSAGPDGRLRDVVGVADEQRPGTALLDVVWDAGGRRRPPPWTAVRDRAQADPPVSIAVSDALAARFTDLARSA